VRPFRDLNDWHVSIWFDQHDPAKAARMARFPNPNVDIVCLGDGSQELIEPFAQNLLQRLQTHGAFLIPGDRPTKFEREVSHATAASNEDHGFFGTPYR
jgi:hypothetical protein